MGIFSFFNRQKKIESANRTVILGIVLLKELAIDSFDTTTEILKADLHAEVAAYEKVRDVAVLIVDGYQVLIAPVPHKVPGNEVKIMAEYNYFWPNAVEETAKHKGHLIVSIVNGGKDPVKENLLFSKVVCSLLKDPASLGFYMAGRTLVLEKNFYLNNAKEMFEGRLPLYNWIYFGLRQGWKKQSIYTYGLADFGKKEMEIVHSDRTFEELNALMYNVAHYVLASNEHLKSGEALDISGNHRLIVSESKGKFIYGTTLKIEC